MLGFPAEIHVAFFGAFDAENPWNSIRFFSNSAVLPRFGRTSINGIPFEYRLEPTRLAVRSPGKPWGTATPVEWLGEENGELRVRVGSEVVRHLVRADTPEIAHIFPVSCTDRFSSLRYDVSEEETEGREIEQATSEGASMITCPMPGSVCRVLVKNGEKVKKGDIVVVIEAMKMEVGDEEGNGIVALDHGATRWGFGNRRAGREAVFEERAVNFPSYFLCLLEKREIKPKAIGGSVDEVGGSLYNM